MTTWSNLDDKTKAIQSSFAGLLGSRIARYETAEILHGVEWSLWPDLPIRLYADTGQLVAIAWSKFDDLWVATDYSIPFSVEGSTVRWVENSIPQINPIIGARVLSVLLGRDQMTFDGREFAIWRRLLIELDVGWFGVFNALDENGYAFHAWRPDGDFVSCA